MASGTLEEQPLWEEGRGRGQETHKASAQEPQMSVPWEEWRLSPPVRVFFSFHVFSFFFNPLKEARRRAKCL